jgi:uncharacterized protein YkwD
MRTNKIFLLLFSLLLLLSKAFSQSTASFVSTKITTVNKNILLQLVNEVRKKGCTCGDTYYAPVAPLSWNNQLEKAAFEHSSDMNQHKYFSHTAPDGSNAGDRISSAGYKWRAYGENIALGYLTEQEVITGWLHSSGHCKNIMSKDFKEMGVSRVGDYWTQELAR